MGLTEGLVPAREPQRENGSLDFDVGPRSVGEMGKSYDLQLLFGNKLVVVCRQGHPLSHVRSLRGLIAAEWIIDGLDATG